MRRTAFSAVDPNRSAAVMDGIEAGETYVVTRNGAVFVGLEPMAEIIEV